MKKKPVTIAAVLLSLSLVGCAAGQRPPIAIAFEGTSANTRCPSVTIEQFRSEKGAFGIEVPKTWTATGCDREWSCRFNHSAYLTQYSVCEETPASKETITRKVVVDRLALETMCPANRIAVTSQSEWRTGTETAYRLTACDQPYICVAAAGRVDCKKALSQ